MNKINKDRTILEHEKFRYSMIRKGNDETLHDLLETKVNATQTLSAEKLAQIENGISAQSQNIQALYYQNTKNELLQKG
jgi:hypothetical protein